MRLDGVTLEMFNILKIICTYCYMLIISKEKLIDVDFFLGECYPVLSFGVRVASFLTRRF